MCRIAGIIAKNRQADTLYPSVKAMCDAQMTGGPDDEGVYYNRELGICLGNRRLSLLDLSSAGHQPMSAADEKVWITYNGEVYNFQEIRKELEFLGHFFRSGTDTEVILKSYLQWGVESFAKFNGMFAFALADLNLNKIFLVRDSVGIKPLYYGIDNQNLYFNSEVKAFKYSGVSWTENPDWQLLLLAFGHIPEPYTTLANVFELPKGSYLTWCLAGQTFDIKKYRSFKFSQNLINSREEAKELIRENLHAAVKRHLISDAPSGVFLSGGIDSSILSLLAAKGGNKINTLSLIFNDENLSETKYQNLIAKAIDSNHAYELISEDYFHLNLGKVVDAYDMPGSDGINLWFVSKFAKDSGIKAVQSGVGGDELFGGYPSFLRAAKVLNLNKVPAPLLSLAKYLPDDRMKRLEWMKLDSGIALYLTLRGIFNISDIAVILGLSTKEVSDKMSSFRFEPYLTNLQPDTAAHNIEFNLYMQNQLLKDSDYMSMKHGVELRVPFLDQEFLEAVFRINPKLLFSPEGLPKQLLIDSFKHILPEPIWNRSRMGFSFPLQRWLSNSEPVKQGLAKESVGRKMFAEFKNGKLHWSKIWVYFLSKSFKA